MEAISTNKYFINIWKIIICSIINPNKFGLFKGSFFCAEGGEFDSTFTFQVELI